MKKYWIAAVAGLLLFSGTASAQAELKIPAAYIAIGDSLAAGQTPEREIDAGYADMIAQELSRNQPMAFYSKNLAFPGFTTADVLDSIQSDEAKSVLASANLITVSAGANDLLRLVQDDPAQGSLTFQQIQADFALNEARKNMELILAELTELSPNADVYVMGYYFAYPHVRDSQKSGTAKQLDRLNEILERSAEKAGATFVSVDQSFGDEAVEKIPNAADVHPNAAGYQAMANAFFDEYQATWTVEDFELPPPNPLTFEQIMEAEEQDGDGGQEEEGSETEETAQRPSNHSPTGYLALREAMPFI
ncbi:MULTISPECIES: SGNH/GDSL hydrolase family protein [Planococcus]|uniref:SGNH/GDSL hydrolase family protein n=1 Tax=Planococcus wigleyi TaxID=2762216 RepID=A0ABR8WHU9_9BACL|nr:MULTISPECIES: SGNH/GDSL hydrolase family protein [Planococcus]MBD8016624.1 SGNH/GDSL hydrolase family protein [Planococcus wigleyi]MDN3439718.1 SGNH/GDSL hydrolase family protein [Planococcus sp. APC 3900]